MLGFFVYLSQLFLNAKKTQKNNNLSRFFFHD